MNTSTGEALSRVRRQLALVDGVAAGAHLRLELTGSDSGTWNFRAGPRNDEDDSWRHSAPDIQLCLDSADFVDLVLGFLEPARAYMQGKIQIKGDRRTALLLLAALRAIESKSHTATPR